MRIFFCLIALIWPMAADRLFADGVYWQKLVVDSAGSNPHLFTAVAIDFWQNIFIGTRQSEIYRSGDDGSTWNLVHKHSDIHANASYPIKFIAVMPTGHLFAALTGDGLYLSKDHGDHWSIIGLQDYFHLCSAVHPDGRIYVGGSNPNGLFTSHDEGRNWRIVHYQQPDFHRSPVVSDVAIGADYRIYLIADGHPSVSINESPYAFLLERAQFATSIFVSRDQSIYIGAFEGHVLYSADRGAHFTRVSIPGLTATISCFSEDRDGALYFGTEGNGIWRSDDRGNSWLKESLADSVINDLTADSSGRIYAAANSGLYRRMENSTWAQRRSRISDRTMPLVSAYPNPFNSSMAIEVQFDGGPATVKIVDAIGRPVATLYDQALAKGVHRFHWNGKDEDGRAMCSGVYFVAVQCTVQGSTFKPELHKIILLR